MSAPASAPGGSATAAPAPVASPPVESPPPPAQSSPPPSSATPSTTPPPASLPSPPPDAASAPPPQAQASPPSPALSSPPPITAPPPQPSNPTAGAPPPVSSPPPPVSSPPPPDQKVSPLPPAGSPPGSAPPPAPSGSAPPPAPSGSAPPPAPSGSAPPPAPSGSAPPPAASGSGPSPPAPAGSPPLPPAAPSPPASSPTSQPAAPATPSAPPGAPSPSPPAEQIPSPLPPSAPGTPGVATAPPRFTNTSPALPTNPSAPGGEAPGPASSSSFSSAGIVGVSVAGIVLVAVLGLCIWCILRKRKNLRTSHSSQEYRPSPSLYKGGYYDPEARTNSDYTSSGQGFVPSVPPPSSSLENASMKRGGQGSSNSIFTYEELTEATSGFSRSNMLGEGGFGCVYKGILPGGQEVAIKQLKVGGGQGEREFRAEVETISRIHHRHLVTLVGYCIDAYNRLLVYEFVPNGTLDYHLHGKGHAVLEWSLRMKIAIGSARGLAYLHEDCHPKIIHRDIKSSNILLDNNYEAQVADFGLAKFTSDAHTHVTTRVMGTFGYLAPEYASSGKLTDKSDVYSFGVVLLELITGRKPVDISQPMGAESLVEWMRPLIPQALETGNLDKLADPLLPEYNKEEMLMMLRAASACVKHSSSKRPKMIQVVRILESDSDGLQLAFGSDDHDSLQYGMDTRGLWRIAMQGYGSDYSGPTSEYGLNPSISSSSEVYPSRESELPLRSNQM